MSRLLTAAQVMVRPDQAEVYREVLGLLAARLAERGQHVWLFRQAGSDRNYLEFTEGPDPATHRVAGPADADEAALEARLGTLGKYDDSAHTRWDAISLAR
ncbi:MAG TPA: hypothetical protein VGM77_11460 [Gemmatimonadales bacterium]|jgi:hypothetical protein